MNWSKKINAILGFFWTTFWQDSWLIESIVKFFQLLIGRNLLGRIQSICAQTQCKSLLVPENIRYVQVLVGSSNSSGIINIQDLYIGSSYVDESASTESYKILQNFDVPDYFQLKVSDNSTMLLPEKDFNYYPDRGTIQFNKQLPQYGFQICVQTVGNQLKSCYQLWAVYREFKTLRDNFTGILNLPASWLYKYPGAIEAAWSIKQKGANQRDVKRLLGAIGFVQDIDNTNFVYTHKTGLPQGFPGIHVVTDVGVLYASNESDSVSDNILPLLTAPGGTSSPAYRTLCTARNVDTKIPYAELPSSVNPAKFIFQKVLGPSAVLIVTPSSNQKDMKLAVNFIAANTALGTMLLAYMPDNAGYKLLYPDKQVEEELMIYYNTSVNNGTEYKERLGDFAK